MGSMAKKSDNTFASSAGLMRYFDTEDDKGIRVSPKVVIGIAIGFSVLVILMDVFFPVG
jgi:preprotein translocase subunit Sec61beta